MAIEPFPFLFALEFGEMRSEYLHSIVMVVLGPSAQADIHRRAIHEFRGARSRSHQADPWILVPSTRMTNVENER
jgi:hypothetical protein